MSRYPGRCSARRGARAPVRFRPLRTHEVLKVFLCSVRALLGRTRVPPLKERRPRGSLKRDGGRDLFTRSGSIASPCKGFQPAKLRSVRTRPAYRVVMPKLGSSAGPETTIFLGAGFSRVAGVPLAAELFRDEPAVDRIVRQQLVRAVQARWLAWHGRTRRTPEEYLAELEADGGLAWREAVWYASLVIAMPMGTLRRIGNQPHLTVTKQNIDRTSVPIHERFWTAIFSRTAAVTVVTTNYDILAERGMRHCPRPRVPRPGFNYGEGHESLAGGGYPSYAHIQRIVAGGDVPLLKLHGSISWAARNGNLVKYHDCRPAIRGDALIVAPVRGKHPPRLLDPIWARARAAMSRADRVLVVGYSLPEYDDQVIELLRSSPSTCTFHLLDPAPALDARYESTLERATVQHPALPDGISELGFLDHE